MDYSESQDKEDHHLRVLDHGYVELVDWMGSDEAIVQAARVSTAKETDSKRNIRGLIRFLMRNHHTTPFEQVVFKFKVKMPIFVARQLVRHRTQCLTGDTILYFDLPGGLKRRSSQLYKRSLADMYRLWNTGAISETSNTKRKSCFTERVDDSTYYSPAQLSVLVERSAEHIRSLVAQKQLVAQRAIPISPTSPSIWIPGAEWHRYAHKVHTRIFHMRHRIEKMRLRSLNENTSLIEHTGIANIWEAGIHPTYKVTLENGYTITCTKEHRFLSERGWGTLADLVDMRVSPSGDVLTWIITSLAVNGIPPYQDKSWLAARKQEGLSVHEIATLGGVSYYTIRKWLKLHSLQFTLKERGAQAGRSLLGRRRGHLNRVFTEEHLKSIREARSGTRSNFWKGGTTTERANIGRWTREHAARTHAKFGYACIICLNEQKLVAHHLDPVWHNKERVRDTSNLVTLCSPCHQLIHTRNLELDLLSEYCSGADLLTFFETYAGQPTPTEKKAKTHHRKMLRQFSEIKSIDYVGERMTYDVEVSGPHHNFIADGFVTHNSINEHSLRYSEAEDDFYFPTYEDVLGQGIQNKQGSEGELDPTIRETFLSDLVDTSTQAYQRYEAAVASGISRERARLLLPVNLYTRWYSTINLWNLFHMLKLRMDAHAQWEIREYAYAMYQLAREICPLAVDAFDEYVLYSATLSREDVLLIREILRWADQYVAHVVYGSRREPDNSLAELMQRVEAAKSSSQGSLREQLDCTQKQWATNVGLAL